MENKSSRPLLQTMYSVMGLMTIAFIYDPRNMAFAGCMAAFFLVTIIDAVRTIRRNHSQLLQTMLTYKSGIAYTLCSCAVLALLPLWFIIPKTAHPAIAWAAFFSGLTILTIRLIRS